MTVIYGKKGITSFPWSIQVQHSSVCIFHGWQNNRLTDLNHVLNHWLTDSPSLHLSEAVDESTIRPGLATLFGSYKNGIEPWRIQQNKYTKGSCPRKIGNEAREIWQAVRVVLLGATKISVSTSPFVPKTPSQNLKKNCGQNSWKAHVQVGKRGRPGPPIVIHHGIYSMRS